MKILTNKSVVQKIIIAFVLVLSFNFCMAPTMVHAEDSILDSTLAGYLYSFLELLGDVAVTVIQYGLTGEWNYAVDEKGSGEIIENGGAKNDYWKTGSFGSSKVYYPVIQISPELIFSNQVEILDVNFISGTSGKEYALEAKDNGAISELRTIIASWYVTLRTLAIVGLLSVLIYVGIRIIISSTSQDKAKYKQRLIDWIIAFCLLFFMHYIMAATTFVIEEVNGLLSSPDAQLISIPTEYGEIQYVHEGDESVSSGTTHSGGGVVTDIGDNMTDDEAIAAVKTKLSISSSDIISEGPWTEAGTTDDTNGAVYTSKTTYVYNITYNNGSENKTAVLYKTISNSVTGYENNKTTSYSYSVTSGSEADQGITTASGGLKVSNDPSKVLYYINYVRLFLNNSKNYGSEAFGWLIIYIILIVFIGMFALRYMKRVIYVAFLTLIAPLVALTYPLDKIKDRKGSSI